VLLSRAAVSARLLLLANRIGLEEIARRLEHCGAVEGAEAEAILCADEIPAARPVPKSRKSRKLEAPPAVKREANDSLRDDDQVGDSHVGFADRRAVGVRDAAGY
jgi:hypothetical protein